MPFAEVGPVNLFYTDEGAGDPPMLFVHGYSCDSHDWMWQLPHFASRHRVIAMDLRGHGRSSVPDEGYEYLDFVADTAGLIEHLGCGPIVAVGHSLGGVIVSALAVERPDLVRAVVSVDPGYLVPDEWSAALDAVTDSLAGPDPASVAQAFLATTYSAATPEYLQAWHMRRIAGDPPHVLRQTLANLFGGLALSSQSGPYLTGRKCPVLAVYAHPDRAATEAELLTDEWSRTVTFEGSGHWLHQERPVEFNHIVDGWLAALP